MSGELIGVLQLGSSWEANAEADALPSFVNRVPFVIPSALVIDLRVFSLKSFWRCWFLLFFIQPRNRREIFPSKSLDA